MILVTGATGHIGNVLVKKLVEAGEQVRILVLPADELRSLEGASVEVLRGDTRIYSDVRAACEGVDMVYHLAAIITIQSGKQPHVFDVNVGGTENMLSACKDAGVKRLLHTSSIHAFRRMPHGVKIDETIPFDPENSYGVYDRSKAQATLKVQKAVSAGLDAVIVCPTGVVGPFDYQGSLMGSSIVEYARMKDVQFTPGGYDFVDVRDVADGMILAASNGRTGEAYLLSGEYITNENLAHMVLDLLDRDIPIRPIPLWMARALAYVILPIASKLTGEPVKMTPYSLEVILSNADISHEKATRELGYSPRPLRDSVADALAWYRAYGII